MRVLVKNLSTTLTSDQLKREFQRAGKCSLELHQGTTQDNFAYVDYLDIVNASEAIKLFHGKDFAGNKISVTKEYDCVVNLSQKRGRENTSVLNPVASTKVISLTAEKKNEVNLNGLVYLGGKHSEDNGKVQVIGKGGNGVINLPSKAGEAVKVRKVENAQEGFVNVGKVEEVREKVQVVDVGKVVGTGEKGVGVVEKAKPEEKKVEKVVYNTEKVVKPSEKVSNASENTKTELEPKKNDIKVVEKSLDPHSNSASSLTIEIENNKFLKTGDETKLHCILCNKEITKKGVKAHLTSKSHKSLL